MADAPNDVKQQSPVWTGSTPVARLSKDELPNNPKRVIRTFASDMATAKGTPGAPAPTPPQAASQPVPPPAPAAVRPPPRPAPVRMPQPVRPAPPTHTVGTLTEAVARINMPQEEAPAPEPHLPPLQKQGAPMYVRRPESVPPPPPRQSVPISEGIVYESQPSFFSKLVTALFGRKQSSYTPPPPPVRQAPPVPQPTPQPVPVYEPAPAPAPLPPPPAPLPTPQPYVEAPIGEMIPSTAATEEAAERDAVLARLRARVSTYQSENVAPPPVFPTPLPAPARPRMSAPPINLPGAGADAEIPERLRTWSNDFSTETASRNESAFSILAAQADAPRPVTSTTVEIRTKPHGLAYALAGTVLVVGGSLVLYFTYNYFAARSPVSVLSSAPAGIIMGDDSATIEGSGPGLLVALANAANVQIAEGDVRLIYLSVSSSTPTGTMTLTEGGTDLVKALALPAPNILLRNIGANSSVGVVHAGNETRTFFIITAPPSTQPSDTYERLFAGMFSWESTIGQDLGLLYPSYGFLSDGSSTPPGAPRFVDETVQSHDVRALKDSQNRTILLYGFRDQGTLIIARDETAFGILLARLSASH